MLKSYLIIALRNLRKYRTYAVVNIAGLAVGLAGCLLIVLYVQDELSYDRFHENADRIYRIVEDKVDEGRLSRLAATYGPLAPALRQDIPAVEQAVRVLPYSVLVSREAAKPFQEDAVVFVDSTFFAVFDFPLLQGDARTALDAPFSVVLTVSTAQKYFGAANPVGEVLQVRSDEDQYDFTVTGVVADPPPNTHLRFDFLASFASMRTLYGTWVEDPDNWEHPPVYTYALLTPGTDVGALEAGMPAFALKHMGEGRTLTRSLHWEPLTDIRLRSAREGEWTPTSDITYVYVFSLIALLILAIAGINFMNLATARAATRAREVGMRKVLGAHRPQLIRQFLSESTLLTGFALVLALVLTELMLPALNAVSGKSLSVTALLQGPMWLGLVGTGLVVGILAGSYPAFYLSAFRPAWSLKGVKGPGSPATGLRQGLVVFQFVISMALIIGTTVIHRQLDYLQNQRLGFDKEHVVVIPLRDQADQINNAALKQQWAQIPTIHSVAATSGVPGISGGLYDFWVYPDNTRRDSLALMTLTVDYDFVETLGLDLIAGRDFSEEFPSDASEAFLINESAARKLGWTNPVGREFTLQYYFRGEILKRGTVIGVVKDFQYQSLHHAIAATVLHIVPNSYYSDYLTARVDTREVGATLAQMGEHWQAFNTERPFEYFFLDETFDALYRAEERLAQLFGYFAILAIVIACLGLFGLAAFTAEQRTKEIGVRKVLGATVGGIVLLLSKDLLKLVAVAFVLSVPLAYAVMHQWLDDFAYRIEISWPIFLMAGLTALGVALMTVSYHAVKAALTDPVKSLRYE